MSLAAFASALFAMIVISFALTALGLCIAWRLDSTQGFHAIMNLFPHAHVVPQRRAVSRRGRVARFAVGHDVQPAQLRPGCAAAGRCTGASRRPEATPQRRGWG
jgi:hypothetical protein